MGGALRQYGWLERLQYLARFLDFCAVRAYSANAKRECDSIIYGEPNLHLDKDG